VVISSEQIQRLITAAEAILGNAYAPVFVRREMRSLMRLPMKVAIIWR